MIVLKVDDYEYVRVLFGTEFGFNAAVLIGVMINAL
jgi:hypothetical protein